VIRQQVTGMQTIDSVGVQHGVALVRRSAPLPRLTALPGAACAGGEPTSP
jgi:hypothetical protein